MTLTNAERKAMSDQLHRDLRACSSDIQILVAEMQALRKAADAAIIRLGELSARIEELPS